MYIYEWTFSYTEEEGSMRGGMEVMPPFSF
jgi:hypothetical protein